MEYEMQWWISEGKEPEGHWFKLTGPRDMAVRAGP